VGTVAAAKLDAATVGNLLTTNQASVETDTTGFSAIAGCTIARTTAQAKVGAASLLVTSTTGASGGGAAGTPRATSGKAVTPGVTYTGIASVLNGVGTRTLQVRLLWWDAVGAFISTADGQTSTAPATWATLYATGVAPANAAYVSVEVNMTTVGAIGDAYYIDCLGLWLGAGGTWALPGTPIANLGFYTDESVGRRLFQWDANNARWQTTFSASGIRALTTWDAAGVVTGTALPAGWGPVSGQAGFIRIERNGPRVTTYIQMLQATSTNPTPYPIPSGFSGSPVSPQFLVPMVPGAGAQVSRTWQNSAGLGRGASSLFTANDYVYAAEITWQTTDAWPTALPGTAVGTIPQ